MRKSYLIAFLRMHTDGMAGHVAVEESAATEAPRFNWRYA